MFKEELEALGIDLRRISHTGKTRCPKCFDSSKGRRTDLSVNVDEGWYKCHNSPCDFAGHVRKKAKKEYTPPVPRLEKLSEKTIKWFESRGISNNTLLRYRLTESKESMPEQGEWVLRNTINFNYYEVDGSIFNIKFRDAKKNFKLNAGSKLGFYGMDVANGASTIIIVEGEIDVLTMYECGIDYSISVPNGASKGNLNLEYLDNCWEFFKGKEVIIATDGDEPGIALREELARRLGKQRCKYVLWPNGYKDANEVYNGDKSKGKPALGKNVLRSVVEEARAWPIEAIDTVDDLEEELNYIYENGYPEGMKVGGPNMREHISFMPGQISVITGIPGSGKTMWDFWVQLELAYNYGWKGAIFSPETSPSSLVYILLMEQYVAKPYQVINERYADRVMSPEERQRAMDFVREHFVVFRDEDMVATIDGILEKAEELVLRKGIRMLTIDPWNWVEKKIPQGMNDLSYTNDCLNKIVRFARKHQVHVFIVAHPRKLQRDLKTKEYEVPSLYDVSGSSDWFNKAHNGIVVYRRFSDNSIWIHIQKIKFKWLGKIGDFQLFFDVLSNTYSEDGVVRGKINTLKPVFNEDDYPF